MSDSAWQEPSSTALAGAGERPATDAPHFHRSVGLFSATAVNMIQICGVGPFLTIPAIVAVMNGPLAVVGWILGAVLAMADGLVWAELGAAMPGAGGTYLYVREAFQYRTGKLMPFLFVWTAMLSIPLIMSTGIIGFVQYLWGSSYRIFRRGRRTRSASARPHWSSSRCIGGSNRSVR